MKLPEGAPPEALELFRELLRNLRIESWNGPVTAGSIEQLVRASQRKIVREFAVRRSVKPHFVLLITHGDNPWRTSKYAEQLPLIVKVPFLTSASKQDMFGTVRAFAANWGAVAALAIAEGTVTWAEPERDLGVVQPQREVVHIACQSHVTDPQRQAFQAMIHRPRKARPYLGPWLDALGVRRTFAPLPTELPSSISGQGLLTGDMFDLLPEDSEPQH